MRLKELRLANNETQQQLAEIIGVKRYTIADWEQERAEPSIKHLISLSKHFKVSIDLLLTN